MNRTQKQFFLMAPIVAALSTFAAPIKVGIIGLDAHAVPWTQIIHGPKAPPPISDLRIVAAVPAPSADIPFSQDNIETNTARMRELGVEILFTIMGPGCQTVSRAKGDTADLVTGTWNDGRVGTFRGILRGQTDFGATVFGEKSIALAGKFEGYEPLLVEIAKFFQTGQPPMSVEHTLEIYAFMEAADESLRQGGRPVSVPGVLEQAQRKP